MKTYDELSGPLCIEPINIANLRLFTDSAVCLCWIQSYACKLDKMQNRSIFVMNRLLKIANLCQKFPITFGFCAGEKNPADLLTRPTSYKQLVASNYHSGPDLNLLFSNQDDLPVVVVPNPEFECIDEVAMSAVINKSTSIYRENIYNSERASTLKKVI